nr:MAG TPA: hypothetical protein [Caudoviricetes sp.]
MSISLNMNFIFLQWIQSHCSLLHKAHQSQYP